MRFDKIAQNVSKPVFCHPKRSPKLWANSSIFTKLSKVSNHPIGENSPNLVTLIDTLMGLDLKISSSCGEWDYSVAGVSAIC
jgi:hypothetical protein